MVLPCICNISLNVKKLIMIYGCQNNHKNTILYNSKPVQGAGIVKHYIKFRIDFQDFLIIYLYLINSNLIMGKGQIFYFIYHVGVRTILIFLIHTLKMQFKHLYMYFCQKP